MFFRQLILIVITGLFAPQCWSAATVQEFTLDVNIPSWTLDSVYGDNAVYTMSLVDSDKTYQTPATTYIGNHGGMWIPALPDIPQPGDTRCLDDDCNYYLDLSKINLEFGSSFWGSVVTGDVNSGGYQGAPISSNKSTFGDGQTLFGKVTSSSLISVRKKPGVQFKYTGKSKTISLPVRYCDAGRGAYYATSCSGLTNNLPGMLIHINITVPPPT